MELLRTISASVLLGLPCLAWFFTLGGTRLAREQIVAVLRVAAALAFAAAATLLVELGLSSALIDWRLLTWLSLPDWSVAIRARCDGLALTQLALSAFVMLVVLSRWSRYGSLRWLMLAWIGVTFAAVADNLGQVFVGWTLSAWSSSELVRPGTGMSKRDESFRPVWLVQRVSDAGMLIGMALVWLHFDGSLKFSAWTSDRLAHMPLGIVEAIAVSLFLGIVGRCAQLPLTVWLELKAGFAATTGRSMFHLSNEMVGLWHVPHGHQVSERLKADPQSRWHLAKGGAAAPVMAWWLCAAFLPVGVALLWRCQPLFDAASNTRLLSVVGGVFTLLLASVSAVAQNNSVSVLSQLIVGQCGLVVATLGLNHPGSESAAWFLLVFQSVFFTMLLTPVGHRTGMSAIILLASGFWGRHTIADWMWQEATSAMFATDPQTGITNVVLGTTAARLMPFVVALVCLSESLLSFALIRMWYLSRRQATSNAAPDVGDHVGMGLLWAVAGLGAWMAVEQAIWIGLLGLPQSGMAIDSTQTEASLFGPSMLLPLSVAGAILGWWLYSRDSSIPDRISAAMGPFARLGRNRFYWDDLYFLLFVHPLTSISERWASVDDRARSRGGRAWRELLAEWLRELWDPLINRSAAVYSATTISAVAVLAWLLLWLRS